MPTFLTTSKMNPELAERIEAAVRGRRRSAGQRAWARYFMATARLTMGALALLLFASFALKHKQRGDELARDRVELLREVRRHSDALAPSELSYMSRASAWLIQLAGRYEGDLVDAELGQTGKLASLLGSPMVYVRGPIDAFASATGLTQAATESYKDAFLLCLLHPPAARTEKLLFAKVLTAFAGGDAVESLSPNVRRLHDPLAGLPILLPAWAEQIASAEPNDLARLRKELTKAPVERAKQAAKAELLLVVLDEADEPGGFTSFDGEHTHPVRIGVVNMTTDKVWLRMRKRVDPSWISEARRNEYARGLDSCALGIDVNEAVRSGTSPQ